MMRGLSQILATVPNRAVVEQPETGKQQSINSSLKQFVFAVFLTDNRPYVNYIYDHPPCNAKGEPYYFLDAEMYKKSRMRYESVCMEALRSGAFHTVHIYTDAQPSQKQRLIDERQLWKDNMKQKIIEECSRCNLRCDVTTAPRKNGPRSADLAAYETAYRRALERQDVSGVRQSRHQLLLHFQKICEKMAMVLSGQLLGRLRAPENAATVLSLLESWKEMYEKLSEELGDAITADSEMQRLYLLKSTRYS